MDSRRLMFVLIRTAVFFVLVLIAAVFFHWTPLAVIAVALTGAAALVQLGGVLWLRRSERQRAE
jgi:hypothetical protein